MCANSSERGFTLPELIGVLLVVGVLAVVAMPRLQGAIALREDALRDEVLAALRYAQHTATSHRRLVCVTASGTDVSLSIAAANPAAACTATLPGPDGTTRFTSNPAGAAISVAPAGVMYFQPNGRVTSDGAGTTTSSRSIAIAGVANIVVVGETGHVR